MNRAGRALSLAIASIVAVGGAVSELRAQTTNGPIVLAQAEAQRPGIFRFLFRDRSRPRYVPPEAVPRQAVPRQSAVPRQQARPRRQSAAKPRKKRAPRSEKPAAPREIAAVEKAPNAKRVLVVGDFMAGALAKGLAQTYAQDPNVLVVDASNGSSGLVRQDYYDWPGSLPGIIAEQKPDAILALLGANDRQTISTATGPHVLGSEGWRTAYGSRVASFADTLKATGKPVLWTGLAPVRSSAMSRDYSAFNGIIREQLEARGIKFIDVWNGFANEEGKFVSNGPDVSGQSAQLRDSDGLNFTRAGQRKLAYFVEQELTDILGGATPMLASTGPATVAVAPPMALPPVPEGPKIGPMIPLDALTANGGTTLSTAAATAPAAGGDVASIVVERLGGEQESMPPAGRADNYSWSPQATP